MEEELKAIKRNSRKPYQVTERCN